MKVNINLGILVWIMHGEPIPFTKNQHAKTAFVVFLGATVVYLDFFKLNVKTKTFFMAFRTQEWTGIALC